MHAVSRIGILGEAGGRAGRLVSIVSHPHTAQFIKYDRHGTLIDIAPINPPLTPGKCSYQHVMPLNGCRRWVTLYYDIAALEREMYLICDEGDSEFVRRATTHAQKKEIPYLVLRMGKAAARENGGIEVDSETGEGLDQVIRTIHTCPFPNASLNAPWYNRLGITMPLWYMWGVITIGLLSK